MNKFALTAIVVVYLLVGTLYAIETPAWQVPDEPAHYNYVRQLAEEQRLPVLKMDDYDQDYVGRLTNERFPPELSVEAVAYEDWQPPLYYLLSTPIYLAFDGALIPLRLFSVVLGAGVVLMAYAVAATIFPHRPLIALGTAAFVAFLPQHVAMMAGANNDSLTELLIGLALWMIVRWLKLAEPLRPRKIQVGRSTKDRQAAQTRSLVVLGVVLGLGLVTKPSFAPLALVAAMAVWIVWWREDDRAWGGLLRTLAAVSVPAMLIAAPWWLRNVVTYGGLDIYGTINHDAVVVGQPRTVDWIQTKGLTAWLERWATFTFQSFWGQFGWMGVLMPTWLYRALALWSGTLVIGLLHWLRETRNNAQYLTLAPAVTSAGVPNTQLITLAATLSLVILVYVYYNVTFVQHQGRYLFPALIPIALGAALGTDGLLRLARSPERFRPLAFIAPYLAMVALDLYALWRFILPALA